MANDTWKLIITEYAEKLPQYNDYLISEFRKDNIAQIPEYLNMIFHECEVLLNNKISYLGYTELSPKEMLVYLNNSIYTKTLTSINSSSFKTLKFSFKLQDEIYNIYINIPFMIDGAIIYEDTKYYPIFPIIEKGLYRSRNELRIKVLRAWLKFFRTERINFTTINKETYFVTIITAKLHQSSRGKNNSKVPLPLYHLSKYGFKETQLKYNFEEGELYLTDIVKNDHEIYEYIRLKPDTYIKVKKETFKDIFKFRYIGSLISIFTFHKKFTIEELNNGSTAYFKTSLGRYTYKVGQKDAAYCQQAEKSIEMNETLVDPATIYNLKSMGIDIVTIYDLLFELYFNIDKWLRGYNPVNFYDKKIGKLDQMMGFIGRNVFTNLYKILNNKVGLNAKTMKEFVNKSSNKGNWISKSTIFRSNPAVYNDNSLFAIHLKRFRSLENEEVKILDKKQSRKDIIPMSLLKSHYTQLIVESVLSISSNSPIKSGNINPYLQITDNGDIIIPSWTSELEKVYK